MEFKKLRTMLLVGTMAVSLTLTGCGKSETPDDSDVTEEVITQTEDETEDTDTIKDTTQAEVSVDNEAASEYTDANFATVEIMAEVVELEDNDVLIICDTDGYVYELKMPESFTDEEKALYVIGTVLKISYDIDTSTEDLTIVSDAEVSLVTGTEALEVRSTLIEKGFVTVEDFAYEEVLEYYEMLYTGMTDILVYSPEELTTACEAAWGTASESDAWETVRAMEKANFDAYVSDLTDSVESSDSSQEEDTDGITTEAIIQLTNEYRVSQGVAELAKDEALMQAAQIRAEELAAYGNINVDGKAHVRLDGSLWTSVLSEVKWAEDASYSYYGENCIMVTISADNPPDSSTLVNAWIESEGHRLNMINSAYTLIGVGVAWNGDTCYAVQIFGYYE